MQENLQANMDDTEVMAKVQYEQAQIIQSLQEEMKGLKEKSTTREPLAQLTTNTMPNELETLLKQYLHVDGAKKKNVKTATGEHHTPQTTCRIDSEANGDIRPVMPIVGLVDTIFRPSIRVQPANTKNRYTKTRQQ